LGRRGSPAGARRLAASSAPSGRRPPASAPAGARPLAAPSASARARRLPAPAPAGARRLAVACGLALAIACGDRDLPAGEIEGGRRAFVREDPEALAAGASKRILFGDLHVHSTYSIDAFVYALPLFGGEGAHPPADACDSARYCAQLDFFSINDHSEGLTPERWARTKEMIRECNARAGDPADPDLVAFVGYEWTQAGNTPETHFGHKNVILPGLAEGELPARPITSLPDGTMGRARPRWLIRALQAVGPLGLGPYADFLWWIERMAEVPDCAAGVDSRELPPDCRENAPTPELLFEKLAQQGLEALVVPHGLAWGIHAPPGARLNVQLTRARHDPERQRLLEVFSGHGSSEEFRRLPGEDGGDGASGDVCPEPTRDFLPCCWRAGEIVRQRCGDLPPAECDARVAEARRLALKAGVAPQRVVRDTQPEDWLDCDQCRGCFKPAMSPRPRQSAQYALALSNAAELGPGGEPLRFRFGLIASSDNHSARAATGYKQLRRLETTDARGIPSELWSRLVHRLAFGAQEDPRRAQPAPPERERGLASLLEGERVASFMYPGGLVAVHAAGRDRRSIWEALVRREVYGTSGPRILLWFDLENAPGGPAPMGSQVVLGDAPRFAVRAVGSFVQQPGCPPESAAGLSAARLARLCGGECYHPADARRPIDSIEVVRIRPRREPGEDAALLVEDPWRRFACPPDPAGCRVAFEDPEYPASGRDAVYYVRALEAETPAVNGANLRTRFDAAGRAVAVEPCYADWRTPADDDCLAPVRERAWSSPIFVDRPR
jgi:hypothetical protein